MLAEFLSVLPVSVKVVLFGMSKKETKREILDRIGLRQCEVTGAYVPIKTIEEEQEEVLQSGLATGYRPLHPALQDDSSNYHSMIMYLCSGYGRGDLSATMHLFGLPVMHDSDCGDRDGAECKICEHMCFRFPWDQVASMKHSLSSYFPNRVLQGDPQTKIETLLKRPGAVERLKSNQQEIFRNLLKGCDVLPMQLPYGRIEVVVAFDMATMTAMQVLKDNGMDPSSAIPNVCDVLHNEFVKALRDTYRNPHWWGS